jgi:PadR family transcriptional regulator, regulatory protein PadR
MHNSQIHNNLMYVCVIKKILIMIYSSELIKGTLKTIVLKQLENNKRMYGYEITQRVKELTFDRIQITEGALYPTLHALEAEGLVTTETEYIGKRVRKYYSLSPEGKTKIDEKISELADFMNTMRFLLDINPQAI